MIPTLTPSHERATWESLLIKAIATHEEANGLHDRLISKIDALPAGQARNDLTNLHKQLKLHASMVGFIKILWGVTVTAPGEAAAITLEHVDDEDRETLRLQLTEISSIGEELLSQIKSALE